MLKLTLLILHFLIISINLSAQDDFKKPDPFMLNLLTGYETFNNFSDLNAKLELNGFEKVNSFPVPAGIEIGSSDGRNMLLAQIYATNPFKSKPSFQTVSISAIYGYDLLPKIQYTFLYPLIGARLHDIVVNRKRNDGKVIDSHKPIVEALFGIGGRQYLNKGLTGALNNIGINFLVAIPVINSRWRKDGREFISGTYKTKPTFSITFTFGRAFYPRYN